MNILVTGGAGFIGSHVVDAYINAGHSVAVIDNLSSGKREYINPKAKFYQTDIREFAIDTIFNTEQFDVVNHHAAQMDVRKSVLDPIYDSSVNILGTLNVLENCKRSGVKKIIFASTGGAIYGEQDYFPADELHPTRPVSPYGISKLAVEQFLFYYHHVHGIHSTILRYANVYGPLQNPHGEAGVIAIFCKKLLLGEPVTIFGDGNQTRDFVYVEDIVQANIFALEQSGFETYNVGTGIETTVNTIYELIAESIPMRTEKQYASAKEGEQQRSVISFSRIHQACQWLPRFTLKDGLTATVKSFSQNQKS